MFKENELDTFTEILAERVGDLAEVTYQSSAVEGTQSSEWVEGTPYFDERVKPHAADTDLFVVTMGGNDLLYHLQGIAEGGDIFGAIGSFNKDAREVGAKMRANLLSIVGAIRAINPDADVVYMFYVDYPNTDLWDAEIKRLVAGVGIPGVEGIAKDLVVTAFRDIINDTREDLAGEDLVFLDMWDVSNDANEAIMMMNETPDGTPDSWLIDLLHFNQDGHDLAARQLIDALGGVDFAVDAEIPASFSAGFAP